MPTIIRVVSLGIFRSNSTTGALARTRSVFRRGSSRSGPRTIAHKTCSPGSRSHAALNSCIFAGLLSAVLMPFLFRQTALAVCSSLSNTAPESKPPNAESLADLLECHLPTRPATSTRGNETKQPGIA